MKNACPKKMVSNIPVLASVCLMRSVYQTNYCVSQELFVKFMAMVCRKFYNIESFPKFLRQLGKNEDNFMLTWNSGTNYQVIFWILFHMFIESEKTGEGDSEIYFTLQHSNPRFI